MATGPWPTSPGTTWKAHLNQSLPYASGDGLWVGIDLACYPSGVLDTFRLPKFSAAFFASQLPPPPTHRSSSRATGPTPESRAHGLWQLRRGRAVPDGVLVETQQPYAGYPTGTITHPPFYFVDVPNERGTLRADCRVDGAIIASHTVQSPGDPASLHLRAPFTELRADGSDLTFVYAEVRDANGTVVPTSAASVEFTVEGGTLAGPGTVTAEAGIATTRAQATPRSGR